MPEECKHYWLIEPAEGPTSPGECQNCQEIREFKNSTEKISSWSDSSDKVAKYLSIKPAHEDGEEEDDQ